MTPINCGLPGSSVYRISQARILEWVAISFSMGPSCTRHRMCVSSPALSGGFFTTEPPGKRLSMDYHIISKEVVQVHGKMPIRYHEVKKANCRMICMVRSQKQSKVKTQIPEQDFLSSIKSRFCCSLVMQPLANYFSLPQFLHLQMDVKLNL